LALAIGLALLTGSSSTSPAAAKDILGTEKKLYSQLDEELVIRDFFQDRRGGFFVDIGCADPEHGSTTYYLERHLGWSGIGVDARIELAPLWLRKRRQSKFFSYLITDHSDTQDPFYVIQGAEGLSSTEKERDFMGKKFKGEERKVPSITLNDLLDQNKVTRIDFMSVDIEGHEITAFAAFDIERFKPELMCVEASPLNREKLLEYFSAHGYERIEKYLQRDALNWYFRPKAAAPQ
jgi:FkbM family methyltransferase